MLTAGTAGTAGTAIAPGPARASGAAHPAHASGRGTVLVEAREIRGIAQPAGSAGATVSPRSAGTAGTALTSGASDAAIAADRSADAAGAPGPTGPANLAGYPVAAAPTGAAGGPGGLTQRERTADAAGAAFAAGGSQPAVAAVTGGRADTWSAGGADEGAAVAAVAAGLPTHDALSAVGARCRLVKGLRIAGAVVALGRRGHRCRVDPGSTSSAVATGPAGPTIAEVAARATVAPRAAGSAGRHGVETGPAVAAVAHHTRGGGARDTVVTAGQPAASDTRCATQTGVAAGPAGPAARMRRIPGRPGPTIARGGPIAATAGIAAGPGHTRSTAGGQTTGPAVTAVAAITAVTSRPTGLPGRAGHGRIGATDPRTAIAAAGTVPAGATGAAVTRQGPTRPAGSAVATGPAIGPVAARLTRRDTRGTVLAGRPVATSAAGPAVAAVAAGAAIAAHAAVGTRRGGVEAGPAVAAAAHHTRGGGARDTVAAAGQPAASDTRRATETGIAAGAAGPAVRMRGVPGRTGPAITRNGAIAAATGVATGTRRAVGPVRGHSAGPAVAAVAAIAAVAA